MPRKLSRVILNALAALSLALCVATASLFGRGWFVGDCWLWYDSANPEVAHAMYSGRGRLRYVRCDYTGWDGASLAAGHYENRTPTKGVPDLAGLGWVRSGVPGLRVDRQSGAAPCLAVTAWHAVPLLATAILPATWWLRANRLRRRIQAGRCPACGYDLRATPGRCPECGKVPAG